MRAGRARRGFTVIELLIAIAVIGILASIGLASYRPPEARILANDWNLLVRQGRYEAIQRNYPVAVVWDPSLAALSTVLDLASPSVASACSGSTVLRTHGEADYPRVSVISAPASVTGIVWLPSGQVRSCTGGVPVAFGMDIDDGRRLVQFSLTSTGKVEIR